MYKDFKKIFYILKTCDLNQVFFLVFFIALTVIFEVVGIGILIPLVSIIVDNNFYKDVNAFLINEDISSLSFILELSKIEFLNFLIFTALIFFLIKSIVVISFVYYLNTLKVLYEQKISEKIINCISASNDLYFLKTPAASFIQMMSLKVQNVSTAIINVSSLLAELLIFFSLIIFLIVQYSSNITLMFISFILIFLALYYLMKNKLVKWSYKKGLAGNEKQKFLIDIFQGIKELIIYSGFKGFINDYLIQNKVFLNAQKKLNILNMLPRIVLELSLVLFVLASIFIFLKNNEDITVLSLNLGILLIVFLRLFPSINRIVYNFNQFKFASEAVNLVYDTFIKSNISKESFEKLNFKNRILIKNVNFRYNDKIILEKINLTLNKNSKIVLTGDIGSGKSTVLELIIGFIEPTSGQIYFDNYSYDYNNTRSILNCFSYVPQKSFLFNSSIRQNITLKQDNENIDEKKLSQVLKFCNLEEFVKQKEKNIFFECGEFGNRLSGGQKQKIGIARALYLDKDIIVIDEATNAMDDKNEEDILNNLTNLKDKTLICVSHNQNKLHFFDEVYKIEDRKLVRLNIN